MSLVTSVILLLFSSLLAAEASLKRLVTLSLRILLAVGFFFKNDSFRPLALALAVSYSDNVDSAALLDI